MSDDEGEWFGAEIKVRRGLKRNAYGTTEAVLYVAGVAKCTRWFDPDKSDDEVLRYLMDQWLKGYA